MQRAYRGGGGGTTHDALDRKGGPTFNTTPIVRQRGAGVSPTQGRGEGTVVMEFDKMSLRQPELYIVRTPTSTW